MSSRIRIGLIVNPVAGMGGSVGLKGSDGQMWQRAVELGARPVTPERARRFLSRIRNAARIELLVFVLGPGSDLLLRELVMGFGSGRKVVMASPSFVATVQVARRFADRLVGIRLSPPEFALGRQPLLEELVEPSLVVIDNPNNPTGRLFLDRETVEEILGHPDTLLIVDEAYFEFSGLSFAGLVADHANLALARTLDKAFGLAEELRDEGVLVLDLSNQLGPGYIRVAVGTPEQNDTFVGAYRSVTQRRDEGSAHD